MYNIYVTEFAQLADIVPSNFNSIAQVLYMSRADCVGPMSKVYLVEI